MTVEAEDSTFSKLATSPSSPSSTTAPNSLSSLTSPTFPSTSLPTSTPLSLIRLTGSSSTFQEVTVSSPCSPSPALITDPGLELLILHRRPVVYTSEEEEMTSTFSGACSGSVEVEEEEEDLGLSRKTPSWSMLCDASDRTARMTEGSVKVKSVFFWGGERRRHELGQDQMNVERDR